MEQIFLIADLHFGHSSILRYENRPFKNVNEMNRELIKRWNSCVGDEDRIYVLGDVSMLDMEETAALVKECKGRKSLIMGNHDIQFSQEEWRKIGFEEVSPYPILIKEFYWLSHEPLYINRNMPYCNIFAHIHGNPQYRDYSEQGFCVSVERIGYQPISLEEIQKKIQESF